MTDLVVGSGPAALAATHALLARGKSVTVVDVGRELEEEKAEIRDMLAQASPEDWPSGARDRYRAQHLAFTGGIVRFGSRFALRSMEDVVLADPSKMQLQSSHAFGGLSNVWGAAVLPWPVDDMVRWPVGAEDLASHYKAVSRFMPIAGRPAAYDEQLAGPDADLSSPLPETPQESELVRRLSSVPSDPASSEARYWSGPARRAVGTGCHSCGLCLYGCPYQIVFSTRPEFEALVREGRIGYQTAEVTRIRDEGENVLLETADGRPPISGDRVFLATGVLETTRILFASHPDLAERGVVLRDGAHVFSTFLHRWSAGKIDQSPHHTLSLAFVEFRDPEVSPWLVHNQLYGWNDFYLGEMSRQYARGLPYFNPLFRLPARRLIVAQTFLHSDHCHRISLKPAADGSNRLAAELILSDEHDATFGRARNSLGRYLRKAGLISLGFGGGGGAPGSSFHIGATIPMAGDPGPGETDILGRPAGFGRLHIVDASVMPAIPATTITFSVMANAHRIACRA